MTGEGVPDKRLARIAYEAYGNEVDRNAKPPADTSWVETTDG